MSKHRREQVQAAFAQHDWVDIGMCVLAAVLVFLLVFGLLSVLDRVS